MIHIFTSVVNRPNFVILQDTLFKKFLKNEYTFHIVDDSVDPEITEQFEIACSLRGLQYYRKPLTTKPKYSIPYLKNNGFNVIIDEYQVLLCKE